MQTLEIDASIDQQGNIHLSEEYRNLYGKKARLIVLIPDQPVESGIDLMTFSGTIDWPVDGLAYQHKMRDEWD